MPSPRGKMRRMVATGTIRQDVRETAVVPEINSEIYIQLWRWNTYPFLQRPDGKNKQGGLPPRPPKEGLRALPRLW